MKLEAKAKPWGRAKGPVIMVIDESYIPTNSRSFGLEYREKAVVITITSVEKALELLRSVAVDVIINNTRPEDTCQSDKLRKYAETGNPDIRLIDLVSTAAGMVGESVGR